MTLTYPESDFRTESDPIKRRRRLNGLAFPKRTLVIDRTVQTLVAACPRKGEDLMALRPAFAFRFIPAFAE